MLVIGAGLIGSQRAAALQALPATQVALAGIVDPAPRVLPGTDAPRYPDLDAVPEAAFDAAVIAVPHDVAPDLTRRVLEAGKPVLVEKPLATTAATARDLARLAMQLPTPSFVGYNYRFLPGVVAAIRAIHEGRLGRLRNIDLLLGHGGNPDSATGWKLRLERAGGGVLLDPGVHLLDLLRLFAPTARCRHISCTRGFWPTGIEEDVVATFEAPTLLVTLRVSHIRWTNTFRIEIGGEDGYAILEGRGGTYGNQTLRVGTRWAWAQANGKTQRQTEVAYDYGPDNTSLADELSSVISMWRGGGLEINPRPATMTDAVAIAELCEQLYKRMLGTQTAPAL